ncbi:MAG: phosphatase PAP2 family protein [Bacteroidota bacterium]|jgi:membrane-associated phospholipid phosphatase
MFNKFIPGLFALISLINGFDIYAQDIGTCKSNMLYARSYITDTKHIVKAPLKWKPAQFAAAGLLVGGVMLLTQYDTQIADWVQQHKSPASHRVSRIIEPLGNELVVLGGSAALCSFGLLTNKKNKTTFAGMQNIKTVLISSAFIFGLKHLTHRARPQMNQGSNAWYPLSDRWDYTSFPSGHTTFAFATATTLSQFSRKKIVPVIAYSIAAGVALSRIHDNKHWSSDVLAGAAIGTAFSLTINRGVKY